MQLQTYKYNKVNYTVDYRLSQFRSFDKHNNIVFTDFDSELGDRILCKMIRENVHNQELLHL